MLDIEPRYLPSSGRGLFDIGKKIIQKSANSALTKKILSSATAKNLKKAADSAIGQEIKKGVLSGVTQRHPKAQLKEHFKNLDYPYQNTNQHQENGKEQSVRKREVLK